MYVVNVSALLKVFADQTLFAQQLKALKTTPLFFEGVVQALKDFTVCVVLQTLQWSIVDFLTVDCNCCYFLLHTLYNLNKEIKKSECVRKSSGS